MPDELTIIECTEENHGDVWPWRIVVTRGGKILRIIREVMPYQIRDTLIQIELTTPGRHQVRLVYVNGNIRVD